MTLSLAPPPACEDDELVQLVRWARTAASDPDGDARVEAAEQLARTLAPNFQWPDADHPFLRGLTTGLIAHNDACPRLVQMLIRQEHREVTLAALSRYPGSAIAHDGARTPARWVLRACQHFAQTHLGYPAPRAVWLDGWRRPPAAGEATHLFDWLKWSGMRARADWQDEQAARALRDSIEVLHGESSHRELWRQGIDARAAQLRGSDRRAWEPTLATRLVELLSGTMDGGHLDRWHSLLRDLAHRPAETQLVSRWNVHLGGRAATLGVGPALRARAVMLAPHLAYSVARGVREGAYGQDDAEVLARHFIVDWVEALANDDALLGVEAILRATYAGFAATTEAHGLAPWIGRLAAEALAELDAGPGLARQRDPLRGIRASLLQITVLAGDLAPLVERFRRATQPGSPTSDDQESDWLLTRALNLAMRRDLVTRSSESGPLLESVRLWLTEPRRYEIDVLEVLTEVRPRLRAAVEPRVDRAEIERALGLSPRAASSSYDRHSIPPEDWDGKPLNLDSLGEQSTYLLGLTTLKGEDVARYADRLRALVRLVGRRPTHDREPVEAIVLRSADVARHAHAHAITGRSNAQLAFVHLFSASVGLVADAAQLEALVGAARESAARLEAAVHSHVAAQRVGDMEGLFALAMVIRDAMQRCLREDPRDVLKDLQSRAEVQARALAFLLIHNFVNRVEDCPPADRPQLIQGALPSVVPVIVDGDYAQIIELRLIVEQTAGHRHGQFRIDDSLGSVHAPAATYELVVEELLRNAIKYAADNSVIVVRSGHHDTDVTIENSVSPGFGGPEHTGTQSWLDTRGPAHGLGLTLLEKLASRMDREVWFDRNGVSVCTGIRRKRHASDLRRK